MTEPRPRPAPADEALDPRVIALQRLVGRLTALVVTAATLLVLFIVLAVADGMPAVGRVALGAAWLALMIAAAWRAEFWPPRAYAHMGYRLDDDGLLIRRGVWWRTLTCVPRSRVQHTDVSQGPLERSYGLATLVVYTAGTNHARVALPGLAHDVALTLRDRLRTERADDSV